MNRKLRILYIEDEADIRAVAEYALEDEEFDMLFCECGEDALQKAEAFNPDLILLDVMMPGMDGPTTLKHLRELPALTLTPVIFLTAKVQPNEIEHFKALGAIDVIPKPFDPMRLGSQIKEILERGDKPQKML